MMLAGQAGIKKCDGYGFREGALIGHHLRHVKTIMPQFLDVEKLYKVDIVAASETVAQTEHEFCVIPPHEVIAED